MAQLVKIKTINNLDTDIQVGPDTIQEVRIIRNFALDATRFLVQVTLISGRSYYLATENDEVYFENKADAEALRDAFIATIPNTGGGAVESVNGRQGVVTGLVDEADIVDNLTTNDAAKPLSAKQGKVLQDTKEALTNKAVDFSVVNDTKYPTTKAVKDLVDTVVPPTPSLPKPIYQARVNWLNENGISNLFGNIHYINNPDGLPEFDHTDTIYRRVKEVTFCFIEFETIDPENPPTQPFSEFKRIQNITIPLLIDYSIDPGMPEAPVMEQIDSLIYFPIIFKKLDGTDVTIKVTTLSGNMLLGADDTDFGNLQAEVTNLDVWEEGLPLGSPMQTIEVIIKYESRY